MLMKYALPAAFSESDVTAADMARFFSSTTYSVKKVHMESTRMLKDECGYVMFDDDEVKDFWRIEDAVRF